jgi:hypothetical protein
MCFREVGGTSVTVSLDGLITVTIVLLQEHRVAFATSGRDRQWSVSTWSLPSIQSSISIKGMIYTLSTQYNNEPQIFQIDPPRCKEIGFGLSSPSPPYIVGCQMSVQNATPLLPHRM